MDINRIWSILGKGLVAVLPIGLTIYLIYWIGATAESILGNGIKLLLPDHLYWPGMGLLMGIALLFAVGTLVNAWAVQRLFDLGERWLERIPLVKTIYGGIRDLARMLSPEEAKREFGQVVAVSFDDQTRLMGFVTTSNLPISNQENAEDELVGVYLPMSYQIGGYTILLPRSRLEPIDMSMEDAMRFVLTAGMSRTRSKTLPPQSDQ